MLPLHSYRVETASSARLVNCYAEKAPEGAKGPIILRRAPGITPFAACGSGPGRGLHVMTGALYAVSGPQLYRMSSAGIATALGTIIGSSPISLADNGRQLSVIAEGSGYIFEGGLAEITDVDFTSRNASVGKFIDNYLLLIDADTGQFFCSNLADFSSFDGLDFATAEGAPDNLIALEVDHRAAILIGTDTTELWENAAQGSGFPFARIPNGFIELGGASRLGTCKQDNSVFMVAADRTFRRLVGNVWVRLSQHGVERAWRKYARVDDAECYPYTLDGHLCVGVRFPSAAAAWVYDCTTQEWHEREGRGTNGWDVSGIVPWNGGIYVQRQSTGEIGVLDPAVYREWGLPLRAQWAYQPLYDKGHGITVHRLQMGIETGVGIASDAQASNPQITLERSLKGGREGTFNVVSSRSLGEQGKFKTQVHWDALGSGKDVVFRATLSDPVPLTIWDTDVIAEELAA